jgi:hypothetical protein
MARRRGAPAPAPQAMSGTSGGNKNFAPAFTVPAAMKCDGYALNTFGQVKRYTSVDIRRAIPRTKFTAVRNAIALNGTRVPPLLLGHTPGAPAAAKGFRLDFRRLGIPPNAGASSRTAAEVSALLSAIETAITT